MSDLKDTLLKFTRGVTKTSGELLKSTKLSLALASEEENLKKIYMEIGKKVHEIYQYGGSLGKFFDEKYAEIQQTETTIKEMRNQMDLIKGVKSCVKCGASIERSAGFCPKCGFQVDPSVGTAPLPEQPAIDHEPASIEPHEKNSVTCRNCQAENDRNSKFCLTCGRMV